MIRSDFNIRAAPLIAGLGGKKTGSRPEKEKVKVLLLDCTCSVTRAALWTNKSTSKKKSPLERKTEVVGKGGV